MNLRPMQDRIIVKRVDEETKTAGGIFIPDTAKEKPQQGEVVAIGKGKKTEDGTVIPIKLEGQDYLIMREDDILGVVEK